MKVDTATRDLRLGQTVATRIGDVEVGRLRQTGADRYEVGLLTGCSGVPVVLTSRDGDDGWSVVT